jgi:hypothetical protein
VIPKLSKELAPVLNLSKVTVVGLVDGGEDAALKLVERLQSEFHPISVSKGMKGNSSAGGSTTSSITFAPPKLWTPIGKTNGKRRKKKKGKK